MGNVIVIPAKRQVGNTARQQDAKPKLRVAAYCRVSTDSDEQVEHYTEFIQKNQNGNLPVSTRMMVFPAPTQKSVRTLTV
jgi:site-specific recombinase, phage integrase family